MSRAAMLKRAHLPREVLPILSLFPQRSGGVEGYGCSLRSGGRDIPLLWRETMDAAERDALAFIREHYRYSELHGAWVQK